MNRQEIVLNGCRSKLESRRLLPADLSLLLFDELIESGSALVLGSPLLCQLAPRLHRLRAVDRYCDRQLVNHGIPILANFVAYLVDSTKNARSQTAPTVVCFQFSLILLM